MIAIACTHADKAKDGKDRHGNQRYKCKLCGATFGDEKPDLLAGMKLPTEKAVAVIGLLLEGNSIASINRTTGVACNTIAKLLLILGAKCERYWKARMVDLPSKEIQCDELWGYVRCKEKTRKYKQLSAEFGDSYCFLAVERDTKLILNYQIGKRDATTTLQFCRGLREATSGAPSISTDGYWAYPQWLPQAMAGRDYDFGQIIKIYGPEQKGEARYSPAKINSIIKRPVVGNPDMDRVCTSHVERTNLSIRMGIRRMTRLTNGFSKSWKHHAAALGLFFLWFNFGRVHMTLGKTPAMAHGIEREVWTVETLLNKLADF